jgi:hypothetical protein
MSILKYIKTDKCAICGCSTVIEESIKTSDNGTEKCIRTHVSGGTWEKRKFLCGFTIEYIPNFMSVEVAKSSECCNDPKIVERAKELNKARKEIKEFVSKYDDEVVRKLRYSGFSI